MDIINISNLSKRFAIKLLLRIPRIFDYLIIKNNESNRERLALNNINLKVKKGIILGVVGLNSAGKTTLLKIIAGIMKPTSGICEVKGNVTCCMGFLEDFYSDLTLKDNLYVYGALLGITRSRLNEYFNSRAEFNFIKPFLDLKLYGCSAGIISRSIFALTTFSDADIILFDEVPMSTDINFQKIAVSLLNNLKKVNKTIIISSHNPYFLEQLCDEAILLEEGKIVKSGIAKEVFEDYKNRYLF